ncbi:MAG: hypothetical protein VX367_12805, partial [SAR324 cluster bacterium]|nr:hypothetical protein [SAR324 cluster bacterium]
EEEEGEEGETSLTSGEKVTKGGKEEARKNKEQGRIHGSPSADGWAGAVMRQSIGIQKCDGRTDRPTNRHTDRHGKVKSRVSANKNTVYM